MVISLSGFFLKGLKIYIILRFISIFSVQWVVFLGVISENVVSENAGISPVLTPPERTSPVQRRTSLQPAMICQSSDRLNQFSFAVKFNLVLIKHIRRVSHWCLTGR